jgi:hypothetical protein
MSPIPDLFSKKQSERYGTGLWPFSNPRPWKMDAPPGHAVIIDPVAIAFEAATVLKNAGWPGIGLMDQNFQLELLDLPEAAVPGKVQAWFESYRADVADELERRLPTYRAERLSRSAVAAMGEAISSYRSGSYLSAVRVLMPEFESVGRGLVTDQVAKISQKKVIEGLLDVLNSTPLMRDDPLETISLHHFISEQIFKSCHTQADAAAFDGVPNRHAELHGLESYGNLRGASVVICSADLLLKFTSRVLDLGYTR